VARPKSEDKRNAILDAATRLFAKRGLTAAPRSEISKQAGVAEGTLFTYFKTKDDLINASAANASVFLQVVVSKARKHTVVVCAACLLALPIQH
jgi:DNA-binding transcriptional regulator YbjK